MVTKRLNGKDYEERLRTRLGTWCDISYDANLDYQYKIDFTITRFRDTFFTNPIGVQVTLKDDDARKQSDFLRNHRAGRVVPKAIFIEIAPNADLDSTATIAYIALGHLTFSKQLKDKEFKVVGIRIDSDSYEFFKLEDSAQTIRSEAMNRESVRPENRLSGEVTWYNADRGYGSIYCPNRGEEFYLHIYKTDGELKYQLQALVDSGPLYPSIPVTFVDGGYREGHAKTPGPLRRPG